MMLFADVAQSVEHYIGSVEVTSSILVISSTSERTFLRSDFSFVRKIASIWKEIQPA